MNKNDPLSDLNRRDFLRGSSFSTLMMMMGGVLIKAQDKPKDAEAPTQYKTTGAPVKCGVIGCGTWGREILRTLALLPNAPVVAISDTYPVMLRRAKESAPHAESYEDYRTLLAQKDVKAVIVATASHQHREVVLAALKAGKHVYCEAPLASSVEDARAIAQAAHASVKLNFQSGLQLRSEPQRHFLLQFIRAGAMGKPLKARAQWHKKQSWRFTSPNPEREKDLNWRLKHATSSGLIGELGIHQLDMASWFIKARPVAVNGYAATMLWNDGRQVPDTVQATFEYPEGVLLNFEASIATSFDSDYEVYYGSDSAIMVRESKAWMFKEVDAPLLGWEVYARKESFYKETGIALVMDASKSAAQGAGAEEVPVITPLQYALEAFIANTHSHHAAVEDFAANFDVNDTEALKEYLATIVKTRRHAAGYKEGYESAVMAIKANQALLKRQRLVFQNEWFELA